MRIPLQATMIDPSKIAELLAAKTEFDADPGSGLARGRVITAFVRCNEAERAAAEVALLERVKERLPK